MPHVRGMKRRPSISRRAKVTAVVCIGAAAVLAVTGVNLANRESLDENAAAAEAFNSSAAASASATEPAEDPAAPSASPTDAASEPAPPSAPAKEEAAPPIVISVLGDSTGDAPGEWVDLWAQDLASTATVSLYQWDQTTERYAPSARVLGSGEQQITIWNGSMSGAEAGYPADKVAVIQPETPDQVILSYGHNGSPDQVAAGFQATYDAVLTAAPEAAMSVVIQNPAGPPNTRKTDLNQAIARRWAADAGLPLIDVRAAFEARPDLSALLLDDGSGVHPNDAGSRVWADAIELPL